MASRWSEMMIPTNGRTDGACFAQSSQKGVQTPAPRVVGLSGRTYFLYPAACYRLMHGQQLLQHALQLVQMKRIGSV
jgi:hypothetical protein